MVALTRIKNNQITDSTVNAAAKLQDYSVTAGKLANNITYGSDLTVSGNLTVNGQTTTIDTNVTTIEDPVILLASTQTGSPAVDIGFIGERGTSDNIAFVWDESATEFVTAFTSTSETNTTITISSYANFHTNNANIGGNIVINGTSTLTGNANVNGNLTVAASKTLIFGDNVLANVATPTLDTDAATKGYVDSQISGAGFDITDGVNTQTVDPGQTITFSGVANETTVVVSAVDTVTIGLPDNVVIAGSITGNSISSNTTISATGNVSGGNVTTGGRVDATGNVAGGNLTTGGQVAATGNITGGNLITGGLASVTGNITGGNLITAGLVNATGNVTGGNITTSGDLTGGTAHVTANITGGNLITGGLASVTGNITGGNLITAGLASVTGNITGGNINTGGQVTATGNISGGNLTAGTGIISTTGNINGGNVNTNNVVGTGLTLTSTGSLNLAPTGNISAGSAVINSVGTPIQDADAATKAYVDSVAQGLDVKASCLAATTGTLDAASGGTVSYNNGSSGVGATLTTTGTFLLIDGANIQTAGTRVLVKNEGNAAWNGIYTYTNTTTLTRSTDFDNSSPSGEIPGAFTFIEAGSTQADTGWVCTTNAPVTVGTTAINFTQFSGAGSYTANTSAGLALTGTVFSAKIDDNTTAFDGGGNIIVKAGANLTTPNIGAATGTSLNVTGNVIGGNVTTTGIANVGTLAVTGSGTVVGNLTVTANISGGNISTTGITSTGSLSATGNITGGNVTTAGIANIGTLAVTGTGTVAGNLTVTANVSGGNLLTGGLVSATGNITGGNLITGGLVNATGNITGGNLITAGLGSFGTTVTATGNITGGNLITAGLGSFGTTVTATGNITGGNLITGGLASVTGNITGGNLITGGLVSATGNVSGGNVVATALVTGANVSATSNVSGANVVGTTKGTFGNIVISGDDITDTNGRVNFNTAGADVDFAVNGDTVANVFYVDAGTGTVSFGSATQTTNAIAAFNATNSILLPVGNTGTRPGTGVTGMVRFNTTNNNLEVYDNSQWSAVGVPSFTVIVNDQFAGDGATVAFTLSETASTDSVIVSINGVVQIPTTAYSVSGTTLTFTEAPQTGDTIDARILTTTTTVTSISNASGNAVVATLDTANTVQITGSLLPAANATQSLGSDAKRWKDLYVSGNTIYLGNLQLKQDNNTTFAVYLADGTTQANIDVGSVDVSSIVQGTSAIGISGTNGNAYITVGGTANVIVASTTGANVTGTLGVSGVISGNASGLTAIPGANVTGTVPLATSATTAGTVTTAAQPNITSVGTLSSLTVTANVAGGNLTTGGQVVATGNITGGNLSVGTGTISGGNIVNTNANGVGNIGSSTTYFNTVFAKATSAQYADLAEKYVADAEYPAGTVVVFGGDKEVTVTSVDADRAVAGVVSTNPSYIMNGGLEAEFVATVALTGRVPCRVTGTVKKGDLMVSAGYGLARAEQDPKVGTVIGKALENFEGNEGVIEVVVGRF